MTPSALEEPFFLVLRLNGALVGLAAFLLYPQEKMAQLYSLYIQETMRRRGWGGKLLRESMSRLKKREIERIECEYRTDGTFEVAWEKLLAGTGWQVPILYLKRYRFLCNDFSPHWLKYVQRPIQGLETFLWKERSEADESAADWMMEPGHVSSLLSPFDQLSHQESLNSLGARLQGRLVGWMITHRVDADTIRYSSLFFDHHIACSGYGLILLAEAIRLQLATNIPFGLCEINLEYADPAWLHFVEKRLKPYADHCETRKWTQLKFLAHPDWL